MTTYQEIAQLLDANAITNIVDAYEKGRADAIYEFADALCCQPCFTNAQKDAIMRFAGELKNDNR